jgi:hypothetical protein
MPRRDAEIPEKPGPETGIPKCDKLHAVAVMSVTDD